MEKLLDVNGKTWKSLNEKILRKLFYLLEIFTEDS